MRTALHKRGTCQPCDARRGVRKDLALAGKIVLAIAVPSAALIGIGTYIDSSPCHVAHIPATAEFERVGSQRVGTWYGPGDVIVGYSRQEDSPAYVTAECAA